MSCEFAKKRPGYWQGHEFLTPAQIEVNESRTLFYCSNCLAHAQIVLTELFGEDETNQALADKMPFLMRFVSSNRSHDSRWFWSADRHRLWAGDR